MTSLIFLFTLLQKEKKNSICQWTELFYIQINLYPFEWEFVHPTYGNFFWDYREIQFDSNHPFTCTYFMKLFIGDIICRSERLLKINLWKYIKT